LLEGELPLPRSAALPPRRLRRSPRRRHRLRQPRLRAPPLRRISARRMGRARPRLRSRHRRSKTLAGDAQQASPATISGLRRWLRSRAERRPRAFSPPSRLRLHRPRPPSHDRRSRRAKKPAGRQITGSLGVASWGQLGRTHRPRRSSPVPSRRPGARSGHEGCKRPAGLCGRFSAAAARS